MELLSRLEAGRPLSRQRSFGVCSSEAELEAYTQQLVGQRMDHADTDETAWEADTTTTECFLQHCSVEQVLDSLKATQYYWLHLPPSGLQLAEALQSRPHL